MSKAWGFGIAGIIFFIVGIYFSGRKTTEQVIESESGNESAAESEE